MGADLPDLKFDREYEITLQGFLLFGRFRSFTGEGFAVFYLDDDSGMAVLSVNPFAVGRETGR